MRLGVIVPCRNEGGVIERKLANLVRARWPDGARHRVVVVDDASEDDTRARVEAFARDSCGDAPFELAVVANARDAGKAGAVTTGLEELGSDVDVVVLTDADVVVRPDALVELARAFAGDTSLALACGAQELVRDLAADGTCRGAAGGEPVPALGLYDHWTALVRRFESSYGRLFSVHGQLLAWRVVLELAPRAGIAADDIDLMLQARASRGRRGTRPDKVRLVPRARFLEVKTPPGAARERQALRRARAYFQVLRDRGAPGSGLLDRLQWAFYRHVPGAAPWILLALALAAPALAWLLAGARGAVVAALLVVGLALMPPGRRLVRLMLVIARARGSERKGTIGDRWEMERT